MCSSWFLMLIIFRLFFGWRTVVTVWAHTALSCVYFPFQGKKMHIVLFPSQCLNLFFGYVCLFVWQRLSSEDLNTIRVRQLGEMDICFDVKWNNLHNKQVDLVMATANLPGVLLGICQEENKYGDRFSLDYSLWICSNVGSRQWVPFHWL